MSAPSVTDLRFVVVSGKGGVGRTTVAATLARVTSAAGKRVLLAAAAATDRLGRMFGRDEPLGPTITTLAPGIDGVNITPASSIHEYGLKVLRSELVTRALFENRAVRGLLGAIPGLDGYALLGKAWFHTTETTQEGRPRYDLVIFDGPASGHAGLVLRIPQAILNAMPKGPLARDARAIKELLQDPTRAALLIVTLAEDLPVRESVELAAQARALSVPLGPVVVNALPTAALSNPALDAVLGSWSATDRGGTATGGSDAPLAATLRMAAGVRAHREAADRALGDLKRDLGLPMITLPRIPTAEIGPAIIAELTPHLAEQLR